MSKAQERAGANILQCTSLADMRRLGGCGTLKLPADYTPTDTLMIPSALAAMANYIVQNGISPF